VNDYLTVNDIVVCRIQINGILRGKL